MLLRLIDNATMILRWVKVPSHTTTAIEGNRRADRLAEEGRLSSSLYQVLSVPERAVISIELLFTPTPSQAPAMPRSLEIQEMETPLRDTPTLIPGARKRVHPTQADSPVRYLFGTPPRQSCQYVADSNDYPMSWGLTLFST